MADDDRSPADPTRRPPPIACTLTTKEASQRVIEWQDLRAAVDRAVAIDGGVRMTFPATMAAGIRDLAERERNCCAFLTIGTSVDGNELTLEVTSANPDALPIISQIAGISLP